LLKFSTRLALEVSPVHEQDARKARFSSVWRRGHQVALTVAFKSVALASLHIIAKSLVRSIRQRSSRAHGAGTPSRFGTSAPARHARAASRRVA